ncbi:alpha/beta hydrolase [Novosphingobium sp. G106]|uniref:alpha/beta fold hydrolase n=1 Tax=Novosphingobium sp. G106 TaxID=2849500 RepID=UPI001C2DDCDA|nr:alpha/beta hydrolase [Novosphingobium sp. G106]MBV1691557.1 alpha/beta hydrolase [Novosphingobium sp. G106]
MEQTVELIEDAARGVRLEVLVAGEGPDVVLVPSAMRGASDFAHLQQALAAAGYRSLAVNPRNAGRSAGPLDGLTLQDIADDISLVVGRLCDGPVHLVGHALGNVCVRAAASFRPEIARSVTVMPCGGHDLAVRPVAPEVIAAMPRCHDESLSDAERIEAMRTAFFAPGNDPSVWLDGWWPQSAGVAGAIGRTDPALWWRGGEGPILIVMPLNDAMMAAEAGRATAEALGERASYVEVDNCGHAILPEQPEAVARHVIAFLDRQEGR